MKNPFIFKQVRLGVMTALMMGMFSISMTASALPTGGLSDTATFKTNGNTMDITSQAAGNLITWQDFSIASGQTVNFNGSYDYLNVVLGNNQSVIEGAINGASANVYLVNPNGILFGDGASVNVGSLHLSTADISGNLADYTTAMNALNGTTTFKGDVVNRGTFTAAQEITVEGNNITFKNVDKVTAGTTLKVTATNTDAFHVGRTNDNTLTLVTGSTSPTYYTLISTKEELQNIALNGNYMLANDIVLEPPSDTDTGFNFTPIGGTSQSDYSARFNGKFDGLNYSIENLYINVKGVPNTGNGNPHVGIGLFNSIGASGVVENLVLKSGKVTADSQTPYDGTGRGEHGSFAGQNHGTLRNVVNEGVIINGIDTHHSGGIVGRNTGTVDRTINWATVTSNHSEDTAGIVGQNSSEGSRQGQIKNSVNRGDITVTKGNVGGIVGGDGGATTDNVTNYGTITGNNHYDGMMVGGIAGNVGNLSNAYNKGKVVGVNAQYVGGIAGLVGGKQTNIYNNGDIESTGAMHVGGIAGWSNWTIDLTKAYNTGQMTINSPQTESNVGGILGYNSGKIDQVYNELHITSDAKNVGGIVGYNKAGCTITNVYNTGAITGKDNVGGIAGYNEGTIARVYNTGAITSTNNSANVGGIVGTGSSNVTNAFYTQGGGTVGTLKTEAEIKQASTFTGFAIDTEGKDTPSTWRIYEGHTAPLLTTFLTPLDLSYTTDNVTVTYDGQPHSVAPNLANIDSEKIFGVTLPSHTNVGTYDYENLHNLLYSNQQGYNIKVNANGKAQLVIEKRPVSLGNFETVTKTYDGTDNITSAITTPSLYGIVSDDVNDVTAAITGTYADKNVGTDKNVTYTLTWSGNKAGNYALATTGTGKGTVTQAPLTFTVNDYSKEYDGETTAPGASYAVTNGVIFNGDSASGGTFYFDDAEIGTGKTLHLKDVTVTDGNNADNYAITYISSTNSTITQPAPTPTPEPTPAPTPAAESTPVQVIEKRLAEKGTNGQQLQEAIATATAQTTNSVSATNKEKADDNRASLRPIINNAQGVNSTWNTEGLLTLKNNGINPPKSMSTAEVARRESSTSGIVAPQAANNNVDPQPESSANEPKAANSDTAGTQDNGSSEENNTEDKK